jgi:AcrR family transcriptional regulator
MYINTQGVQMQYKKESIKQDILKHSEKLFLEKGFDKTSVRGICKLVNITPGNFYHYYPNKESLYIAVFNKYSLERLKFIFSEMEATTNSIDKLKIYADSYLRYAKNHIDEIKFSLHQDHYGLNYTVVEDEELQHYSEQRQKYSEIFLEVVKNGQHEGLIRKNIDPKKIMKYFTMTIRSMLNEVVILGFENDDFYFDYINFFLDGIKTKEPSCSD